MSCVSCNGKGCEVCNESGYFYIAECPLEVVTEDVWDVMEYADLYKRGLPPVAGGALDQARVFTQACRIIWAEKKSYEKEKAQ